MESKNLTIYEFLTWMEKSLKNMNLDEFIELVEEKDVTLNLDYDRENTLDNIIQVFLEGHYKKKQREENRVLIESILKEHGDIFIDRIIENLEFYCEEALTETLFRIINKMGDRSKTVLKSYLSQNTDLIDYSHEIYTMYNFFHLLRQCLDYKDFILYIDSLNYNQDVFNLLDYVCYPDADDPDWEAITETIVPVLKGLNLKNESDLLSQRIYEASLKTIKTFGAHLLESLSDLCFSDFFHVSERFDIINNIQPEAIEAFSIILNIPENFLKNFILKLLNSEEIVFVFHKAHKMEHPSYGCEIEDLNIALSKIHFFISEKIDRKLGNDELPLLSSSRESKFKKKLREALLFFNNDILNELKEIKTKEALKEFIFNYLEKFFNAKFDKLEEK